MPHQWTLRQRQIIFIVETECGLNTDELGQVMLFLEPAHHWTQALLQPPRQGHTFGMRLHDDFQNRFNPTRPNTYRRHIDFRAFTAAQEVERATIRADIFRAMRALNIPAREPRTGTVTTYTRPATASVGHEWAQWAPNAGLVPYQLPPVIPANIPAAILAPAITAMPATTTASTTAWSSTAGNNLVPAPVMSSSTAPTAAAQASATVAAGGSDGDDDDPMDIDSEQEHEAEHDGEDVEKVAESGLDDESGQETMEDYGAADEEMMMLDEMNEEEDVDHSYAVSEVGHDGSPQSYQEYLESIGLGTRIDPNLATTSADSNENIEVTQANLTIDEDWQITIGAVLDEIDDQAALDSLLGIDVNDIAVIDQEEVADES